MKYRGDDYFLQGIIPIQVAKETMRKENITLIDNYDNPSKMLKVLRNYG